MQKKDAKKPRLSLGVILPIVLSEILFILLSVLSFAFIKENLGFAVTIVVFFGIFFFLVFLTSIIIYLIRYYSIEDSINTKGKLNFQSLLGFFLVLGSLLLNAVFSWIPVIGAFFSLIFSIIIIAGCIISFIARSKIKQGEKGKGFANIGAFVGIYYIIHLIISIILIIYLKSFSYSYLH